MPIIVQCPNPACGATSPAADAVNGRTVRCKKCGTPFTAKPTFDEPKSETKKNRPSFNANPFPMLPAEFGRYRILRLLGRGGMGAVYLAEDSTLGRQVALKMPFFDASESPQRVERFVREARSAAMLSHPNICMVYDAGEIDGRPFITMAYIAGKPLEDEIDPDAPLPQVRAAEIARKIALALEHAHAKGIVHRDLKPANVMMTADGEPVVMDFGLAKRFAESDAQENKLTREGGVLGTPSYMAPEQVRGELAAIGLATDVYALAVMLFEMLVGHTPYRGPLGVVMLQIQTAPVPPVKEFRADVDARLNAICQKAMAKAPTERLASMAEFAEALSQYLKEPLTAPVAAAIGPTWLNDLTDATPSKPLPKKGKQPSVAAVPPLALPLLPKKGPILAGAAVGLLLAGVVVLWAAGVFRLKTQDGVIVVDNLPADAEVFVDGAKVAVKLAGDDKPIEIQMAPGKRKLEIKTAGFKMETREVMLAAGERKPIGIRLEPAAAVPDKPAAAVNPSENLDPDRKAAEYVLSVGGAVRINDQDDDLTETANLPQGPFRLTGVKLDGEQTTDTRLAHLNNCQGLTLLSLNSTRATDQGLTHFKNCKGLTVLSLSYSDRIGDSGLKNFEDCKGLTWLDLAGTRATNAGLAYFKGCKSLIYLNLDYTGAGDAGLASFKDSKLLKTLGLTNAPVTDEGMAHLQGLMDLYHLNISGTRVSNIGLASLQGRDGLRILYLGQTHISDLSPLKGVKLTTLDCAETQVSDLSPLKGMPLRELGCDFKAERDADILRSIKTLETINGKPAAEFWKEIAGNKAKTAPAPGTPPETKKSDAAPITGAADDNKGFVPLFNGKDLTGWKTSRSQPGNWRVDNAILTGSSDGVSHLYTNRGDYTNFHLRLETRINDGGNSGVYFRAPFGPNLPNAVKMPASASNKLTWIAAYNAKIHAPRFGGLLIDPNPELHRTLDYGLRPGEWMT